MICPYLGPCWQRFRYVLAFGGDPLQHGRHRPQPGNKGGGSLKQDRARISTPPGPPSKSRQVEPNEPKLSGFVFKTQAYTNPKHRDRIAFISVCACRFERGGKLNDGAEV